jgi:electron transfer flavoprotein alpha/beta subunit
MNVLVCLRVTARTSASVLDLVDAQVLSRAVALRSGGHTITALYTSTAAEAEAVAAALAPHVDRAVRVAGDELTTADFHTIGQVLATAIRRVGADLVLAPVQGEDEPLSAAPASIARQLGARYLPLVEEITALDAQGAEIALRTGGQRRRVRVSLPAVLTPAPGAPPLPDSPAAPGATVPVETVAMSDPDATVVRRRTELLGRPEPASRGSQAVGSAADMVAALTRR